VSAEWIAPILFFIASLLIIVLALTGPSRESCQACGASPEKDEDA
jgi:hypothetical protein